MSDSSTTTGRIFSVTTSGADITGFDPARDKLDFGDVSVHNFIVVDTPTGVGFMNPWGGETIVIQGVSLGQLTINSFTPIINDHLRQCLSGALAWEQGVTAAPNTVYARSHELGQVDKVAFNPATDKVDFRYYGSREQIAMDDTAEGVVISNAGTGQALVLLGITKAQLSVTNFIFYPAEVREDRVHLQLGFPTVPDSQVVAQGVPVAGTNAWPTGIGLGDPPSGEAGTTFEIDWLHGVATRLDFDPATDRLDFGWFKASEFSITESGGSTVITIDGNRQTYTLTGVTLGELSMGNIVALDTSARAEWQAVLDAAPDVPSITVADAQIVEGDTGTASLVFTVTLSAAAAAPVSVSYSTLGGSARAGEDFASAVGTVTFAPGETRKTFAVAVTGDRLIELTETLTVQLSSPSGATILDGTATGTIRDNDVDTAPGTPPSIVIDNWTVDEGNLDETHMRITMRLSKASEQTVTVRYVSQDITGIGGVDYEVLDGIVTFAPGETTQTIHAHIYGDTTVEPTETYRILLSGAVNATIADGESIVTIVNDDTAPAPPTLSIADASVTEGNAGTKLVNLTVSLSRAATGPVTVTYATANDTALAGSDYVAKTGTLSFAAGETSKTIQVSVRGDTAIEGNERFLVNLSGATGATIADGQAIATITNDDTAPAPPTISIADASVTEGNAGTKLVNLTVSLSRAATGPVTVAYATANDTGLAGSDYTATSGTLTFAAGETSKTIAVTVRGDTAVEGNERFLVNLSGANGATIADGQAIATITNDDTAPAPPTLSIADATIVEGNAGTKLLNLTVTLSKAASGAVTVGFATGGGTATAGSDYTARTGTLTFAAGETSKTVQVSIAGDTRGEANETFEVRLSNPTGATIADGLSVATITNDDTAAAPGGLTYAVTNNWGSGFVAGMTVSAGSTALKGWTVEFDAGFAITNIWNATIVSHVGTRYVISNVGYNGDVAAGGSTSFGFQGAGGATGVTGLSLNGGTVSSLPALAVGDAAVTEGAAGMVELAFAVTLSAAATGPVSVSYATADGTARAGSDYTAASGTLTFAAGETSKVVRIMVSGDAAAEANETLSLILSAPTGARIGDGTGIGTIRNDDLPTITIADASVQEGNPTEGTGWLSTEGNQIVDAAGRAVQIAGVNWFGFEGTNMSPNGLWTRGYKEMMQQMADEGFNTIRLPFSSEMLHATGPALGIDFSKNPDLQGLTPLQVMDRILDHAEAIGLRVILDHHRSNAGNGASENGLWYNERFTEAGWIQDWQMLATRYADNTAVIGADLHNEPHNGTWGGGGARDWAAAAERAGNAIGAVNPNWLIIVEGVASYEGNNYWWGGNLMGVRDRPIVLNVADKLVYSPHDYPNSVYEQPWFKDPSFPANLPAKFDEMWGFIFREGIAPIYLGEFGTKLIDPKDEPWFEAITSYISGDFDNDGDKDLPAGQLGISWTFWSWNPNSGDTGGILRDDWRTVDQAKMAYLRPLTFDMPPPAEGGAPGLAHAEFAVTLSAPASQAVSVSWRAVAGTADAADATLASGVVTFAAGEQTKTIRVAVAGDAVDEANETFTVLLSNAMGATIADGSATGTIIDDDPATAGGALRLAGTAGADTLTGGAGADSIQGLAGRDVLRGGEGNDTLGGGADADLLTGGAGADRFVFGTMTGADTIADFNGLGGGGAQGDRIAIAATPVGTFAWRGADAFTGGSDNSEARVAGGNLLVDVNGDGTAEITIRLVGLTNASQLSASDIVFG